MKTLFVSRKAKQCGVSDYGIRLNQILSQHFDIEFCEINNEADYDRVFNITKPDIVLYNYHYATLPFITDDFLLNYKVKHYAIFHEASLNFTPDKIIDTHLRPLFDDIELPTITNPVPTIGSFGFGFPNKNYPRIAQLVKEQFTEAKIRLNIPFAEYGDRDGFLAKREAEKVRGVLAGTNIQLDVSHEYLTQTELLMFLRGNDINLFLYDQSHGRGLSSAIDYALSVFKPIGVSNSEMFRHLPEALRVENNSLEYLVKNWFEILSPVYEANSIYNLVQKFKGIL